MHQVYSDEFPYLTLLLLQLTITTITPTITTLNSSTTTTAKKPPIKKRAVPFLSRKLTYVCEIIWSLDEFSIIEACRVIIIG